MVTRFAIPDRCCNQLREILDAALRVWRQSVAGVRDRHDAPDAALDDDRRRNARKKAFGANQVGDPACAGDFLGGHVCSSGTTRAARGAGRRPISELRTHPDRCPLQARAHADGDEHRFVDLEADDRGLLGVEQLDDLIANGDEDRVRASAPGYQRRHPTEGLLLVEEASHLFARLRVDQRRRHKLGESDHAVTRICGERRSVLCRADGEDAPDRAVHDHRDPDDRTDAE